MDDGRDQNPKSSRQSKRWLWRQLQSHQRFLDTISVYAAFFLLTIAHFAAAQTPFQVSNPKQQDWPQAEAERIYLSTARDLAAEFKRPQIPHAHFTLVLGADENSVDMNTRELRLKKWDKSLYAEGVLRLSFDQMLSTEEKMRLARRAVVESNATVRWNEVRASSKASEFWYEEPRPVRGWASQQPR
jgi:hypothetical protein